MRQGVLVLSLFFMMAIVGCGASGGYKDSAGTLPNINFAGGSSPTAGSSNSAPGTTPGDGTATSGSSSASGSSSSSGGTTPGGSATTSTTPSAPAPSAPPAPSPPPPTAPPAPAPAPPTPAATANAAQIQTQAGWDDCDICAGDAGNGPHTAHAMLRGISSPSLSGA